MFSLREVDLSRRIHAYTASTNTFSFFFFFCKRYGKHSRSSLLCIPLQFHSTVPARNREFVGILFYFPHLVHGGLSLFFFYYLKNKISFPFAACQTSQTNSLKSGSFTLRPVTGDAYRHASSASPASNEYYYAYRGKIKKIRRAFGIEPFSSTFTRGGLESLHASQKLRRNLSSFKKIRNREYAFGAESNAPICNYNE